MKLDGIKIYCRKTIVVGIGDEITNCSIGTGLADPMIEIPVATVNSHNYKVKNNQLVYGLQEQDFDFIYKGS